MDGTHTSRALHSHVGTAVLIRGLDLGCKEEIVRLLLCPCSRVRDILSFAAGAGEDSVDDNGFTSGLYLGGKYLARPFDSCSRSLNTINAC